MLSFFAKGPRGLDISEFERRSTRCQARQAPDAKPLRLDHMEIVLMRLELREGHACQRERIVAIRDDHVGT